MKEHRNTPAPQLPQGYAELATQPELAAAWKQEVAVRRAQAARIAHLLAYKRRKAAESSAAHVLNQRTILKAIYRDAAVLLGMTEASVRRLMDTAEFLAEHLPHTWDLYCAGEIDFDRAQKAVCLVGDVIETTSGKDRLRDQILTVVDQEIAERAPQANPKTLQRWLARRVAELDTSGHQERYTRAKARRRVDFRHFPEGMSRIEALLPTEVVGPLEQQLHASVRTIPRKEAADERTYSQRMADVFAGWVTKGCATHQGGQPGERAPTPTRGRISILIPAATLTGHSDAPAISEDRAFTLPAEAARRLAEDPEAAHEYYGALVTPSPDSAGDPQISRVVKFGRNNPIEELRHRAEQLPDLLGSASQSRFFAGNLRQAVVIRDGTCQAPGCVVPGQQAEVDHITAFEKGGATSAENSAVLCHDHHAMKGLGLLPRAGTKARASPAVGGERPDECAKATHQAA
ncbi:HNH endonuclease signature motif containing protein [Nesterenkonia sphaerica]|uniref:DUF222 domain-containing protein n=1 Tax=Nesterenkonia sphaerica TaxID=1804988 RepID=A0A5R9ANM4_9MICC|nr:HNH endonuclease signature motif containing protein [Nesterenkonia sphaerica]TLP79437.1 DUF222 domain-containing protein [Nesterenkonia sphaerica]